MGSVAWEKAERELVPVSQIVTVNIFLGKSSNRATLVRVIRSALEPVAFWPWKPHQEACLARPCSHQI